MVGGGGGGGGGFFWCPFKTAKKKELKKELTAVVGFPKEFECVILLRPTPWIFGIPKGMPCFPLRAAPVTVQRPKGQVLLRDLGGMDQHHQVLTKKVNRVLGF